MEEKQIQLRVKDVDHPDILLRSGAAYVRGKLPDSTFKTDRDAFIGGILRKFPMYRFERTSLPRIQLVMGYLRGMGWNESKSLLDIGTGRGVFIYNLLNDQEWDVTALDRSTDWVEEHQNLKSVGFLTDAVQGVVLDLQFDDNSFELSTCLEVLEHLENPQQAVNELVRVTRGFCIVSVPSRPDSNPQHIQLFRDTDLQEMFQKAGAENVKTRYVRNHLTAVVRTGELERV